MYVRSFLIGLFFFGLEFLIGGKTLGTAKMVEQFVLQQQQSDDIRIKHEHFFLRIIRFLDVLS